MHVAVLPGAGRPAGFGSMSSPNGRMEGGQRQTLTCMSLRSTPPPRTPGYEHHPALPWPLAAAVRPLEGVWAGALKGKAKIITYQSEPVLHMLV